MKKSFFIFINIFLTMSSFSQDVEWLIKPTFYSAGNFSDSYASVTNGTGLWGYINNSGIIVIDFKYAEAGAFFDGTAKVKTKKASINPFRKQYEEFYIDKKGKKFNGNPSKHPVDKNKPLLFRFEENEKYGYKNEKGEIIIPDDFDTAPERYYDYASLSKNGKWGVIDRTGKIVVPFEFDLCAEASEGKVAVQQNGLWGFVKIKK